MRLAKPFAKLFRMGVLRNKDTTIRGYNESPTSITLRVPYVYQEHVNLCVDASAMMILMAWGFAPNRDTTTNPRGPLKGSTFDNHSDMCDEGTMHWSDAPVNWKLDTPAEWLNKLRAFGPLGLSNRNHAQVLIGIDVSAGTVVLHDPWKGPNKVNTFDKFKKEMRRFAWLRQVGQRRLTPDRLGATWKQG